MSAGDIVLGVTGASGAIYALRLLDVMLATGRHVHLAISPATQLVIKQELGLTVDLDDFQADSLLRGADDWPTDGPMGAALGEILGRGAIHSRRAGKITYHHYQNLMAPIASGSFLTAGMVICPCSGGTLGAIVHGTGENLIHRAAAVHLKERRKLVLVPRETPLSIIQLDNLRKAAEAGAVVLPAMPGFYHGVRTIADLVDFVVARICDQLEIENDLMRRWGT
jgi:4-hydroxy-3-polyprenylbenzoate decarboxylase